MRLLIAPLEFKGVLSGRQVAAALARGIKEARPGVEVQLAPLADGGPGTVEALLAALGGERRKTRVRDPLGREVEATWALIRRDGRTTGIIEMAAASGLWRVPRGERDALRASTFGVGELIAAALDAGCKELVIGAGGSATTDGGTGALSALGARFLDRESIPLPPGGGGLERLEKLDLSGLDPRLQTARLTVATDVVAPLLGPAGAATVFGPQKGASPADVALLERGLERLSRVVATAVGRELSEHPGVGAAGGLGFGLAAMAHAEIKPGFDFVADRVGLDRLLAACDLVLTGEGQFDAQTSMGKGPWRLMQRARAAGRPVVFFAGRVVETAGPLRSDFEEVVEVSREKPASEEQAIAAVERAAAAWAERRRL